MHASFSIRATALALLVAAGPPAPAQAPSQLSALPELQHDAVALQSCGRGLVGFGPDYSVRFDSAGMTFTPALGRRVERQQDLALALAAVWRGVTELPFDGDTLPEAHATLATYRRSPALGERYEIRGDGVEQSFVFTALPGAGDLVVRLRLGGALARHGGAIDGQDGLQFLVPGGGVRIGGVTGIDARGARCRGGLRLIDGCLELSLPAAFVDTAVLPLVLDPLVSARLEFGPSPADDRELDAAHDATSGDWLVVWSRTLSATSSELRGRHYNRTTGFGTGFLLATGTGIGHPRVCSHNAVNRFVVVFEDAAGMFGMSTIRAQVVNADRTLGPTANVTDGTSRCTEADLSGNPGSGNGDLAGLIAFRDLGTGARLVPYTLAGGNAGALTLGNGLVLASGQVGAPRLSRSAGARIVVAFGRPGQAVAQVFTNAGSAVGNAQSVPTGGTSVPNVAVDGDGTRFLMAFEQDLAPGDRDIRCVQWTWTGAGITQTAYDAVTQEPNLDEFAPAVAWLGAKYVVLWTEASAFLAYQVHGKAIALQGCAACGLEFTLSGNQASDMAPAIGSCRAGGGTSDDALLLLSSRGQQPPFQGDVVGYVFTPFSAGTSTLLWNGCGTAVTLQQLGAFAIGNSGFALRVGSNDPAASLGLVSFGLGGGSLPCQGCSYVQALTQTFLPMQGGTATYALPVPCSAGLLGLQVDVQGAVLGTPSNFCPLLPQLSTSPASRMTLVE